jgi:hypothetical protein
MGVLLRSRGEETEMGIFTAVADSGFVRRPDGKILYFPWGARRRGYEVPSEARYLRMRREIAFLAWTGIFGLPIFVVLTADRFGLWPAIVLAPVLSVVLVFRIFWSTRGLVRSDERISEAEARAQLADAVSPRSIRRATAFFVVLGAIALGFYLAGQGKEFLASAVMVFLGGAIVRGIMLGFKRRYGRRTP